MGGVGGTLTRYMALAAIPAPLNCKKEGDRMKIPSMEEMIEACEKKKQPGEVIVFALGAGRAMPFLTDGRKIRKAMKEGMNCVKEQDGFLGIHPIDVWHNLFIFDTLNNAKSARNILSAKGMQLGQIAPVLMPITFLNMDGDQS